GRGGKPAGRLRRKSRTSLGRPFIVPGPRGQHDLVSERADPPLYRADGENAATLERPGRERQAFRDRRRGDRYATISSPSTAATSCSPTFSGLTSSVKLCHGAVAASVLNPARKSAAR